jgi:riboflavin synthase
MFSGIIEKLGKVEEVTRQGEALSCLIATGFEDLVLGESVAVNGVCLTVTAVAENGCARFFASAETLARTGLGTIVPGSKVNLERAVSLNTRLSGHLVQGHVDGQARLLAVTPHEGAFKLRFEAPKNLARYCVEKGSITLDGISLTINSVTDTPDGSATIAITIIPHTWEHTNLSTVTIGGTVNVEVDVIAKYVERLCQPLLKP